MRIRYARVSTVEQNLDLQRSALEHAGCERIIEDQGLSGSETKRPGLEKAINLVKNGDTLVVWRLDRHVRSLVDLLDILKQLAENGGKFHSLSEAIDTNTSEGRLVFHMMAALAEFERNLISERTRAGVAAAKEAGKQIGRPRALNDEQDRLAEELIVDEGQDHGSVAEQFDVHPKTSQGAIKQKGID